MTAAGLIPFRVQEWLTALGLLSLLLEYIAMLTLRSPLSQFGIPALSTQLDGPLHLRALHPGARVNIGSTPCRVLSEHEILVRTVPPLASFAWHSPFPLKTVVSVTPGRATVTGAVPVGSCLFALGVAGSFGYAALVVVAFVLICIAFEKARAVDVARSVLQRLEAAPTAS
jgi:hypothetical protein